MPSAFSACAWSTVVPGSVYGFGLIGEFTTDRWVWLIQISIAKAHLFNSVWPLIFFFLCKCGLRCRENRALFWPADLSRMVYSSLQQTMICIGWFNWCQEDKPRQRCPSILSVLRELRILQAETFLIKRGAVLVFVPSVCSFCLFLLWLMNHHNVLLPF